MSVSPGLISALQMLAAVAYLIAAAGYGAHLLLRKQGLLRTARFATIIAVILQTVEIGFHCALTKQTPFTTPADTLSASAWAIALVYLALEIFIRPAPTALGAIALPTAFLCLFGGALHSPTQAVPKTSVVRLLDSSLISLHVIAILFAFGLLVLAFGCAALYLVEHRILKKKKLTGGLLSKLPPLNRLESLAFVLVAYAFPLLTIGLASGIIRAVTAHIHGPWIADPKILASVVMWLIYGLYLVLHTVAHWRGLRANYLLLGGLLIALVTFFIPTSVHSF
jgi:ABC-type uncharacterized transport system permease subunit